MVGLEESAPYGATHRAGRRPHADSRDGGANPRWGAPRIHGELLKLGLDVCQATVARYMGRRRQPPSQTWRTFLRNHIGQVVAADFFVVPTATCRLLFVLVLLAHDRRRIRHVAVTAHPTAAWTAQQLRQAFPWDEAPRYLIHDRDHAFDALETTAKAMGIEEVLTAPHAPWHNAFVERFIGVRSSSVFRSRDRVQRSGPAAVDGPSIVRTTSGPARTCRSTMTRRFLVPSRRPAMAPSWRFRRSVAFIIDTNGARPERSWLPRQHARRPTSMKVVTVASA